MIEWFKIKVIYPTSTRLTDDEVGADDELSETDRLTLKHLELGYETGEAFWDLALDPITQASPRCVIKKGESRKRYFTEVVFQSGNIAFANCKPDELQTLIKDFLSKLPQEDPE